MIFKRRS